MRKISAVKFFTAMLFIFIFSSIEAAFPDGRIDGRKRPSLLAGISLEKTEFMYNAPLKQYISVNFGFEVMRYQYPGLSFGPAFQWLDGDKCAGIVRSNALFLVDRNFKHLLLGASLDISFTAGSEKSGFSMLINSRILSNPAGETKLSLKAAPGVYFAPTEKLVISAAPGFGRFFIDKSRYFFNFSIYMEANLWK